MEKKLPGWPSATPLLPEIAFWVACVSRLIGKSDTTAKRLGWQVDFVQTVLRNLHLLDQNGTELLADAENATPIGVAFRCPALVTGLPES